MLQDQDLISIQEVRTKVEAAYQAWLLYRAFPQDRVDEIVERIAAAARENSQRLAELAVEETGYGNAADKLSKNLLSSDLLCRTMRGMKTVGVIREIPEKRLVEIGVSMGVVAAVLPTTNPTSTAIYKTLISLKAGNAIVLSPHPRARRCTCETAALMYQAALEAGAPEGIVQCVTSSTMQATNELMRHKRTGVILATGGSGMVRAAYSSGKPAFGVGPGNVPVLVDSSANLAEACGKVVEGKSFDFGTVCSSEQTIVAERSLRERILGELKARRAFLCSSEQAAALEKILIGPNFSINPDCVGQAPSKIAKMAGFEVPSDTAILVVEIQGVGKDHPLSAEKLSPVLSVLFVADFAAAVDSCEAILRFGGAGHTSVIHATDDARIREYAMRMPSYRVLVNTPSPQGSTGITTNVFPAMTLGCGAVAGNITSDNVGPLHLINIKRLAYVARTVEQAFPGGHAAGKSVQSQAGDSGLVKREQIVSAVERYLAQRGIAQTPTPAAGAASQPTVVSIVDRFLAQRKASPAASSAAVSTGCGCSIEPPERPHPKPEVAVKPAPEPPPVKVADFVCEADVRDAARENRKIYIGPKTIVTPSARDLAAERDTLVVTTLGVGSEKQSNKE